MKTFQQSLSEYLDLRIKQYEENLKGKTDEALIDILETKILTLKEVREFATIQAQKRSV